MILKNIEFDKKTDVFVVEYNSVKAKTISEISLYFTKKKIDILVITKDKKPFYVITSSDIIDALVAHNDNIELSVFIEKNPKSVIAVSENETVFEAYRLMRSYRIHHLIVVDKEGYFVSVINFYDFASYLTEIAIKDEMTGLYNKRFFEFILDRYKDEEIEIGIIFIDLDNFKKINDKYGHLFGDKILKAVANIIKLSIRDLDYAFRFGGDEFVIMIFADNDVLKKVAGRIEKKILMTDIDGIKAHCSIGYAHYPTDSSNIYEVLEIADKRMYEKKRRG